MVDCPWDLNGDGTVDERDLNILITMWGACVPGSKGDFNNDGVINADDIDILKANFGPCNKNGSTEHLTSIIIESGATLKVDGVEVI